jgi:hypothetical protein
VRRGPIPRVTDQPRSLEELNSGSTSIIMMCAGQLEKPNPE